jgi:hypothetical protein
VGYVPSHTTKGKIKEKQLAAMFIIHRISPTYPQYSIADREEVTREGLKHGSREFLKA